jgi:hypothetical protein
MAPWTGAGGTAAVAYGSLAAAHDTMYAKAPKYHLINNVSYSL